ncbi:unnamed protein product [Trichobilharzia regenti]|nr:unnamed protein product [Trichobilharzia regenti]
MHDIPNQNGTDIYTLLSKHRKTAYSADRMTLAVQSKRKLNILSYKSS